MGTAFGTHLTSRRGQGLEFADFHPYTIGDDFRHIDWKLYGRSERLYVKEFRAEQNVNVLIALDISASMNHPDDQTKFQLAKDLALSLAYIALAAGDLVTIVPIGGHRPVRLKQKREFARALSYIDKITPSESVDLAASLSRSLSQLRHPGRCFIISDFFFAIEENEKKFESLLNRNFEFNALQVLSPQEIDLQLDGAFRLQDAESGEQLELSLGPDLKQQYSTALQKFTDDLKRIFKKRGIPFVRIASDRSFKEILFKVFPKAGLLR
jgi:uncharacterized protein (DUF58 family)